MRVQSYYGITQNADHGYHDRVLLTVFLTEAEISKDYPEGLKTPPKKPTIFDHLKTYLSRYAFLARHQTTIVHGSVLFRRQQYDSDVKDTYRQVFAEFGQDFSFGYEGIADYLSTLIGTGCDDIFKLELHFLKPMYASEDATQAMLDWKKAVHYNHEGYTPLGQLFDGTAPGFENWPVPLD